MNANPIPTITRADTWPELTRRVFVNIAVADLQRSIQFFESLGFTFNPQLTDESASCMPVGTDVFFMLLSRERFMKSSKHPLQDARRSTSAFYAIGVESREAVDATVNRAIESGASLATEPQDYGYLYVWSFLDLDGHHFEVFWIDPMPFPARPS